MSDLHWYVACVRSCQERKVAERLASKGIETYVPVQKVKRQWSDRVKIIDRLVLPGMVFVRCTEDVRASVFNVVYGISFFLMDRTSAEEHRALSVPERQMEDFMKVVRAMNGDGDLEVVTNDIVQGDIVRVIRGPLTGMVCECAEVQSRHRLVIRLGMLGSVLVTVEAADVVRVQ